MSEAHSRKIAQASRLAARFFSELAEIFDDQQGSASNGLQDGSQARHKSKELSKKEDKN
jgi:hypothetical protein